MQYPYVFSDLTPTTVHVGEDGDTHAVYELPAPKGWVFRYYPPGQSKPLMVQHLVSKIRVCITAVGPQNEPVAVVVPFDEEGLEDCSGSITLPGAMSIIGVLDRLGFAPTLLPN